MQNISRRFSFFLCVEGSNAFNLSFHLFHLFGQKIGLLIKPSRDVLALGGGSGFSYLQFSEFLRHMFIKLIVAPDEFVTVVHDFLSGQVFVFSERYKAQVYMRIWLIHMHHHRENIVYIAFLLQKSQRIL